jgi:hypothetical protein
MQKEPVTPEEFLSGTSNSLENFTQYEKEYAKTAKALRKLYPNASYRAVWFTVGVTAQAVGQDPEALTVDPATGTPIPSKQ